MNERIDHITLERRALELRRAEISRLAKRLINWTGDQLRKRHEMQLRARKCAPAATQATAMPV